MPDALSAAKTALASSNKKFPGAMAASAGVKPATARATAPVKAATPSTPVKAAPTIADELKTKIDNVNNYANNVPKMHAGGIVPGKLGEEVPIIAKAGETVIPTDKTNTGRQSEYRKVYIARRQARSGGGNKPVTDTPEKHDQKKAEAGIKEKKA